MSPTDPIRAELLARQDELLRLARRLAVDEARAQDLVQEAWRALLARGGGAVRDAGAFLSGAVRRLARRERSRDWARERREGRGARSEELPSAALLSERLELMRTLAEELARLPDASRALILWHDQEGIPLAEIARRLGRPAGSLRTEIVRARRLLRERLDRRYGSRWAVLALLRTSHGLAAASPLTTLLGGLLMQTTTKLVLGVLALGGVAWWVAERQPLEPVRPSPEPVLAGDRSQISTEASASALSTPLARERREAVETAVPQAAVASARRLLFLDAATREPLPDYAIRLTRSGKSPGGPELVRSNAVGEGWVTLSDGDLPLAIAALDDPENPIDAGANGELSLEQLPRAEAPIELMLPAGPTYDLVFDLPPPTGSSLRLGLSPGREPAPEAFFQHLEPGGSQRVRLDPGRMHRGQLGSGPWTLTATTYDGLWIAWGEVQQIEGRQREPVLLHAEARGAIAVSATIGGVVGEHELGASLYRYEDLELDNLSQRHELIASQDTRYPRWKPGSTRFEQLPPGRYRLLVGSANHRAEARDVDVLPNQVSQVEVDLAPVLDLHELEVVMRSQTGRTNLRGLSLYARPASGAGQACVARWKEDLEGGAELYHFKALPAGEWDVTLEHATWLPPFETTSRRLSADAGVIEFLCLDEGAPPTVRRRARIVDSVTGEALPQAGVMVFVGGERHYLLDADEAGEVLIGPYLAGADVRLHARATGHEAAWTAIQVTEEFADSVQTVELVPGWGTLLELIEATGFQQSRPIANALVRLDGLPVGRTDEAGHLMLHAAQAPLRIEFEGYSIRYGDGVDPSGALSTEEQRSLWIVAEAAR